LHVPKHFAFRLTPFHPALRWELAGNNDSTAAASRNKNVNWIAVFDAP